MGWGARRQDCLSVRFAPLLATDPIRVVGLQQRCRRPMAAPPAGSILTERLESFAERSLVWEAQDGLRDQGIH